MPESTTEVGFNKAHDLAERIYSLQEKQTDQLIKAVGILTSGMSAVQMDVALIKTSMMGIPDRVLALENLRYKVMAFVAIGATLFTIVQSAIMIISTRH